MSSPSLCSPRPIVVLGAGIIGLTTAVRLLESPLHTELHHPIHVIAAHLPGDPLDARYASNAAGAHHLSFADNEDERQRRWDRITFKIMYDEWKEMGESSGLMALKQTEYYGGEEKHLKILEEHPDFVVCDRDRLPVYANHSVSFTSITMTPLVYLNRLLDRLSRSSPGSLHRHHIPSLSSFSTPSIRAIIPSPPLAVIVCTGIGAITLGGVEDTTVFPTRGQVVKVRAPWVREGYTRQLGSLNGGEGGERTYVIPRPDGEVILGGTREVGDWYPYPRADTTTSILRRAETICRHLVPPNQRAPSVDSLNQPIHSPNLTDPEQVHGASKTSPSLLQPLIVSTIVGFRPSRTGGARLERGQDVDLGEGGTFKVVHNYGHGGAGWQSCWGCAEDAVGVLTSALKSG